MRVENFRNDFTKVAKIGVKVALLSVVMQEIYSKKNPYNPNCPFYLKVAEKQYLFKSILNTEKMAKNLEK
ncbi:hypothetical protein KDD93_07885 [Campylobacter sp. faydin G-24]|uniref:Uncharacterized protein n=1 Tax=Campylobacter anatolicus TaxID=2829105 RepID=A0ABS5HJR5_9BACT|nr:hypothetical protein [Campylobacter anatolicus]MBR8464481.1 hypothetical protein [Campylobacter anatolicus]